MRLLVDINLDNAAFHDEDEELVPYEVERCLMAISRKISNGEKIGVCLDSNGNAVGSFEIDEN